MITKARIDSISPSGFGSDMIIGVILTDDKNGDYRQTLRLPVGGATKVRLEAELKTIIAAREEMSRVYAELTTGLELNIATPEVKL